MFQSFITGFRNLYGALFQVSHKYKTETTRNQENQWKNHRTNPSYFESTENDKSNPRETKAACYVISYGCQPNH